MFEDLTFTGQLLLQFVNRNITGGTLLLNRQMGGDAGGLPEGHPGRFHSNRRKGDMRRRGGHRDEKSVNGLRNHDPIRDLIGAGDLIQHAEIAFEDDGIGRLSGLTGEAVDGEFADGDGVGEGFDFSLVDPLLRLMGDVLFCEGEFSPEATALADVELPGEMPVVGEFI